MNDESQEKKSNASSGGNEQEAAFVAPRHWIGPEELQEEYWKDPGTTEKRGQEFYEKPIELIDQIDRLDQSGLARRDFMTVMAASMAMAGFSCARRPVHKIIPYVVKPEEVTPGIPNWYASTCQECSVGCGILVKTREGRPIKLEGNSDHPVNQGALCSRGQASVLTLYDPDRLKSPLSKVRAESARKEMSWSDVDAAIQSQLKRCAQGSGKLRVLTGTVSSDSTRRLIREFLSRFGAGKHVEYEPLFPEEIIQAGEASYGSAVVPHYAFDQAEVVVSFGADFLGTWLSPVEHSAAWAKRRKLNSKTASKATLSKLICFEPMMSVTGANADERYPIRPQDAAQVALALAHELIVTQKRSSFAQNSAVTSLLSGYQPEAVASRMGWDQGAAKLRKIAEQLWDARGRGLVIGGGLQVKTAEAQNLQVVINLLNSALENEGKTVDGTGRFRSAPAGEADFQALVKDMKAGQVEVLILHRVNPAYVSPNSVSGFEDALKSVPLVISISDREDETALLSDYVLPDHHPLENWGDAHSRQGVYSLQQPSIAPIHSSRAFQDSLLTWMRALGAPQKSASWYDYLRMVWKDTHYPKSGLSSASFDRFWEKVLQEGVWIASAEAGSAKPRAFRAESLRSVANASPAPASGAVLALYEKAAIHDGRSSNNSWLQELPDPVSSVCWDNYANVSPKMARDLGIKDDDCVELSVDGQKLKLPARVQPGLQSSVVAVAVGYGRRSAGKVGTGVGVDVFPLARLKDQTRAYSGQAIQIRKTQEFYRLAATQWHTTTENRPIINDISLAEYRKNPKASNHTDPHLRLDQVPSIWPSHPYEGHRWGMSIDLNSCTGCGACVIACQAENNVPVVGRDQVRNSRQMHWIRIDRYYSGSPENPNVLFQPMLCQHCENAPCETVCPVLATVHDSEGLNVQVYNRCVGTRYCQNNCPYKVRRFNFFDHWKTYSGTMNMAWNPDVTVRTRGIMEKCTFCLQRITAAKDQAKDQGLKRVPDGAFKTACQQTCPTQAISFGDINNPESQVMREKQDARTFHSLEVLNTKPVVSYLTKVRNQESGSSSGAHHG